MAAAGNGDAISTPIWSATTNWVAAIGSLRDSIYLDTSESIENDQGSKPLILVRPDGDDPPPCEITINFREKHEIHRVYVRSTARVYEIYCSSDHPGMNEEYLCTVRCGVANVCQGSNNGSTSDEDGWVQVKNDSERDSPKTQIHYEATAEISDYSPCFSITLRLLSIQTKNRVHVEEIYVYADPVESCDPDPPVETGQNPGTSSMFAMLIPSLMQLSKPATENSDQDQNKNQASYTRIEKVLDELVIKVERVEAFCSKFEEKMVKPFDLMEKRLQQLEQKLDALVAKSESSVSEPRAYPGLIIKAPEFLNDDDRYSNTYDPLDQSTEDIPKNKKSSSMDSALASEFLNDDDRYSNTYDPLDQSTEDIPKNNKSSSMDSALASSLAAFLTSTAVKSPNSALDSLTTVKSAIEDDSSDFFDSAGKLLSLAEFLSKQDAETKFTSEESFLGRFAS